MRGLIGGVGFGTTELTVIRPSDNADSRYMYYLSISQPFRKLGEAEMYGAGGQKRVPDDFVRNFELAWPPKCEQSVIAAFLDRETAKIAALVAKQQRLIALLQEKRQALIAHAVTKGLNPDAPMKDSGIEWLGEIPTRWTAFRSKVLFREVDDRSTSGDEELLSVSHITGVTPRSEKNVNMFMAESLEGYKKCRPGDLVINTMWAWMGALGISFHAGIVSPSYNVYRLRTSGLVEPEYYDLLCRTPRFVT